MLKTRAAAFTLLELSIVIIIIALITAMGVTSTQSITESAKRAATENKLDAIEKALMDFRTVNGRLPCPADLNISNDQANYGVEAANKGSCAGGAPAATYFTASKLVAEGAVPVKTLGLPDEYMIDGWGRRFAYAVDTYATFSNIFKSIPLNSQSCQLIVVGDGAGGTRSSAAMYALVSYGPNGHGARLPDASRVNAGSGNANELVNCHCNSSVADTTYTAAYVQKSNDTTFDDIVRFKERWQMQTKEDGYAANREQLYFVTQNSGSSAIAKISPEGIYIKVAGNGTNTYSGDDGPALSAGLYSPRSIAIDASGNIYVASQNIGSPNSYVRVRKIDASTGIITTVAGNGNNADSGDGFQAINASFKSVFGIAVDGKGNLFIADATSNRVRRVDSNGIITTYAGTGTAGTSGDGGLAINAQLTNPTWLAVDRAGNLYISEGSIQRIRKVSASTGIISTLPFTFNRSFVYGVATDVDGNVYTVTRSFSFSTGTNIKKYTVSTGGVTTVAGNGANGTSGDGGLAKDAQIEPYPTGLALDSSGNIYFSNFPGAIRKITTDGYINTIAGTGALAVGSYCYPANIASFYTPFGIVVGKSPL